ncbi:uncharacterized protein ATNIH1004_011228 [Aspergillus tanneri]|uniref:DUF7707 domain-containing protein n=1 Tax=Aspergillus tanneri TaxID=1220188 RepID=A0A5M9M9I3_9EURO|nr:uncharacterized protein ATNIH1004_011228 [Aspergillus tanneri]KAA8642286.1 hypothetical protein ATNIH1004_011228 [Aspergillus tanneri]
MLFLQTLAILASAIGLVKGQAIDPSEVALSTREQWCQSQTSSCPLLCLQMPGASGKPKDNDCSAKTLSYSCICSNNASPNASEYSETIPYYICTERNNQCVHACPSGDLNCQSKCRNDNPCGAQNPRRVNKTSTATVSTPAATTSLAPFTGEADNGVAPRQLVDMGQVYGLVLVVGGFLAGFATLL